ncbi:MAG: hypothetical protein K8I82_10435, partial [Anaerolineae bacterium]|nr:hypothetical protein [Anaerolineae bacterium]
MGYWVSAGLLMSVSAAFFLWNRKKVDPLTLGVSPKVFFAVYGLLLFLWAWVLLALVRFEYIDQKWHQPLAAVIANGGLPVRLYTNPDYCVFYHYAPSLLAGIMFRVSGVNMAAAFDWMNAMAVLAVLGLALNVAWRLSHRRAAAAVLGMLLFFFYGQASWMLLPFQNERLHEIAEETPALDYFAARTTDSSLRPQFFNFGFPVARASVVQPYSRSLHSHSVNLGWICTLLVLLILLEKKSWGAWLLCGLLLGLLPLAYETLWPVPMVAVGLYMLVTTLTPYRGRVTLRLRPRPNDRLAGVKATTPPSTALSYTLFPALLVFVPALTLAVVQGGVITDQLFCDSANLGEAEDDSTLAMVNFPAGPGYYTRIPDDRYISLAEPKNWLRGLEEWGLMPLIFPLVLIHYTRRKWLPGLYLMAGLLLPIIGLLLTNFLLIRYDSVRVASMPILLAALVSADWLDSLIQQKGWRRVLAVILIVGMGFNGVVMLYGQATYDPARSGETDLIHAQRSWLKPIDEQVREQWFGQLGTRDARILDMGQGSWDYVRPGMVFGHYTLRHVNRARLNDILYAVSVMWMNPNPAALQSMGIE